jgi:hypothetical protein
MRRRRQWSGQRDAHGGTVLCASIALIGWLEFPAYRSHYRSVVLTDRAIILIAELNMLRPIEGVIKSTLPHVKIVL